MLVHRMQPDRIPFGVPDMGHEPMLADAREGDDDLQSV